MEPTPQEMHNKLLVDLCDHIDINGPGYSNFITALRHVHLPVGRLADVQSKPAELFPLMEQRGKLKVGDYIVLEKALEAGKYEDALKIVKEAGLKIRQMLNNDSTPIGGGGDDDDDDDEMDLK